MAENDDIVYLDGIRWTLEELGVAHKSLVNSTSLSGKFIPFTINSEMRALYKRAIQDKQSLTPADINRVLGRMPPEEEERLCQKRLGCLRQQLHDKALNHTEHLTRQECDMIVHGFDFDWRQDHKRAAYSEFERMKDLSRDDRALVLTARSEVKDAAFMKALAKHKEYRIARSSEASKMRDMIKAARDSPRPKWLEELADENGKLQQWGFVVIRTADNDICDARAWSKLQKFYNSECERDFRWYPESDLSKTHQSVFIWEPTLDGASTDALRAWFKTKRDELPAGVRRDCFLIADEEAFFNESVLDVNRPSSQRERAAITLCAVDPDYDAAKPLATVDYGYDSARQPLTEADLEGFAGEVRVPVYKVFDWLYYTLATGTETWEERYKQATQKKPRMLFPYWPYPEY